MRNIILFLCLLSSINFFSQEKFIIDTSTINENTKLIGRCHEISNKKPYNNLGFMIEDPSEIKKFVKMFAVSEKAPTAFEILFEITIVQDFKEVSAWIVNLNHNSVSIDGELYKFDVRKILGLNQKYPFQYRTEVKEFKTKEEYFLYLSEQKKDKDFLFDYAPEFQYEGSFEVVFPTKKKTFENFDKLFNKISNYLKPRINKIDSINEHRISHDLTTEDWEHPTETIFKVEASKKVFDDLILDIPKKQNWKYTVKWGRFFYRVTNANKS